jgi:hypothetical protein
VLLPLLIFCRKSPCVAVLHSATWTSTAGAYPRCVWAPCRAARRATARCSGWHCTAEHCGAWSGCSAGALVCCCAVMLSCRSAQTRAVWLGGGVCCVLMLRHSAGWQVQHAAMAAEQV